MLQLAQILVCISLPDWGLFIDWLVCQAWWLVGLGAPCDYFPQPSWIVHTKTHAHTIPLPPSLFPVPHVTPEEERQKVREETAGRQDLQSDPVRKARGIGLMQAELETVGHTLWENMEQHFSSCKLLVTALLILVLWWLLQFLDGFLFVCWYFCVLSLIMTFLWTTYYIQKASVLMQKQATVKIQQSFHLWLYLGSYSASTVFDPGHQK